METRRTTKHHLEPSDARFPIRSLFVAMVVVAIAAALAGPLVRRLEPGAQFRLVFTVGIWFAAAAIWLAIVACSRRKAERLAGATLLRLAMFDEHVPSTSASRRKLNLLAAGFMTVFMLFPSSMMIIDPAPGGPAIESMFAFGGSAVFSIWWVVHIVLAFWWRNSVRFCEKGILWDRRFLRWDYIVDTEWFAYDSLLAKVSLRIKGIDQRGLDAMFNIAVPSDKHEVVQAILDQRVVQRPAVDIKSPIGELATMPLSASIHDRRFPKYLAMVVVTIILMFAWIHLLTSGFSGIQEFDRSIILGLVLSAILGAWQLQHTGAEAGAPLIRLRGRRSWWESGLLLVLAMVFFGIGSNFGALELTIAYVTGIGFGWIASVAVRGLFRAPFDLRENGVLAQGQYWSWPEIRLPEGGIQTSGRLVLARGWRRIVAAVSPEHREAVESVLKQKLSARRVTNGEADEMAAAI